MKQFILLSVILVCVLSKVLQPKGNEEEENLNKILAAVTECFTEIKNLVVFNLCKSIESFHFPYPKVYINNSIHHPLNMKPSYYVICLNKSSDIETIVNLQEASHFNPRAFFFIYLKEYDSSIFKITHEYFLNSLVVMDGNLQLRTYHPFSKDKHIGILLGNMRKYSCNKLSIPKPLWNETKLKVTLFKMPPYVICETCIVRGIEIEILEIVQSILKFKIEYVGGDFDNWGKKINGEYNNAYGVIQRKEAILGLGMFEIDLMTIKDFDLTYPYMYDTLIWVVPKFAVTRNINVLKKYATILLVVTCFLTAIAWWIIARLSRQHSRYYSDGSNVILAVFRIFFGGTLHRIPSASCGRFLFILWVWASWMTNVQIQCYLMYFLTYDPKFIAINDYYDLINSNLKIGLYRSQYADDWRAQVAKEAKGHRIFCNIDNLCLNRTIVDKDLAVVKPTRVLEYEIVSKYLDADGNSRVHLITNTPILLRYVNMCFTKGHPIYDEFDKILPWIVDCGFIRRLVTWYDHYVNNLYNRNVMKRIQWHSNTLDFHNVKVVFFVLLVGYVLGIVCLILEIIISKCIKRSF